MPNMDCENELAYADLKKDSMHLMKKMNNTAYQKNENRKELVNEEMLSFNHNIPDILFCGDTEMVVLNISNYKNTRNDEDAIVNLGEKNP